MATQVFKDARIYVGQYNFSGDLNELNLNYNSELQDNTVLGNTTRTMVPGLTKIEYDFSGFVNFGSGNLEDGMFSFIGQDRVPVTIVVPPLGGAGDRVFFFKGAKQSFQPGGAVGEILKFQGSGVGSGGDPMIQGTVLEPGTAFRSVGASTAEQLIGAVAAGHYVYASLHVLDFTLTPTLDVVVESDTTGFPSATTRITFAQATGKGSQYGSLVGPITDTYYRATYTIGGSGTIKFVVVVGVV